MRDSSALWKPLPVPISSVTSSGFGLQTCVM